MFAWKKEIVLCRGLPGSGKSTLALSLVNGNHHQVVENDEYWCVANPSGNLLLEYEYKPKMRHLAGWWCWAETFRRLQYYDKIAVPNVFIRREQVFGYVGEAKKLEIKITLLEANTPWAKNPIECHKKCKWGAPLEVIQRMHDLWENITQQEIDDKMADMCKYSNLPYMPFM